MVLLKHLAPRNYVPHPKGARVVQPHFIAFRVVRTGEVFIFPYDPRANNTLAVESIKENHSGDESYQHIIYESEALRMIAERADAGRVEVKYRGDSHRAASESIGSIK